MQFKGGATKKSPKRYFPIGNREFRLSHMVGSWPKSETTEDLDFSFEDDEGQGELIPQEEGVGESGGISKQRQP